MTVDAARAVPPDGEADAEPVQLLTPEGARVTHPGYDLPFDADLVRRLYRDLVIVRRMDATALALARQGELGAWPSLLGQEAAQVGTARALAPGDMVFPSYREHGVAWCRGVDMVQVLAAFRGVSHTGWDPRQHNLYPYSIVIGSHALHGTGYAMGIQRDGAEDVAVIYFGDGATSEGDVNEAFSWAAVQNSPVVFVCQNNQWAISMPVEKQSRIPLYRRAGGFGFPGIRVDGNDVLACYAVTRKALEHARSGQGPTLIEALTYRMAPHTTTDDPGRYRPPAELDSWRLRDPIDRVRTHLRHSGGADDRFFGAVDAEAEEIATEVRRRCLALPDPDPALIWAHVYAAEHRLLDDERAAFVAQMGAREEVSGVR